MATKKKMLQAAAGGAGGAGLDITEVFSTYLYEGNGDPNYSNTKTITNGIDLDGEGGLVWIKKRTSGGSGVASHFLFDTVRGSGNPWNYLKTDSTAAENADSNTLTSFNSNGFSLAYKWWVNENNEDYASWTFRKSEKFFDCLKFVGNGTNQTISHNLGSVPGMIIVKDLDTGGNWRIYHRSLGNTYGMDFSTQAKDDDVYWNDTTPTDAVFTVGPKGDTNSNGTNYVAYLFAHNDSGDGGFGPDGDQDIIKCGSYDGTSGAHNIDLGFEPQWILVKRTDGASWMIFDVIRGWPVDGIQASLSPNDSTAEYNNTDYGIGVNSTGFSMSGSSAFTNRTGKTYIYMAVRRGQLALPEAGTEAFAIDASPNSSFPVYEAGFPVDFGIRRYDYPSSGNSNFACDRLRGSERLFTNLTNAESSSTDVAFDSQVGWWTQPENSTSISYMWKRAPGYFDCVAYTGNSTAGRAVSHNVLGVAPEMIWVKNRNGASGGARPWIVYHKDTGNTGYLKLNEGSALITSDPQSKFGNGTVGVSPTASDFTVASDYEVNYSGDTYIAYLFATLAGISKVGSVSHVQYTDTNVDCGFTSGARFVLLKRTNTTGDWWVFDTTRGIAAGDDEILFLNSTAAEFPNDSMSPLASGFTMVGAGNETGDYIFYAIA